MYNKCLYVYSTMRKFDASKLFYIVFEVSYVHQGCIYLIKNAVIIALLWNIITI